MTGNRDGGSQEQVNANVRFTSLVLISLVVIVAQVVSGYLIYILLDDWDERASFGEMFGAVNTLFSGLAFAGVIYAIFLQRRELELQREELEKSARLSAMATLSSIYLDQIKFMQETGKGVDGIADVSRRYRELTYELEKMIGKTPQDEF